MKDMQSSAGCGHSADVPARSLFSLMQGSARTAALKEQMRMPEEGAVIRNVLLARGYMQPVEGETAMLAVPDAPGKRFCKPFDAAEACL